jgi:hypothetical protein
MIIVAPLAVIQLLFHLNMILSSSLNSLAG